MAFTVVFLDSAEKELKGLRVFDQRRIASAVGNQLKREPNVRSRNRKLLRGVTARFPFVPPLWELRVGDFRVFYDMDLENDLVCVRAIRRKKPDQRTEDLLHEKGNG